MKRHRQTSSEIDGVQYRHAKTWQIVLYASNALWGLSVYSLIGMASYSASIGYGIATAAVGIILMGTRIFDAVTDFLVAILYDRVNTRFGKLRVLLAGGFLIEALALLLMFDVLSGKGFGTVMFTVLYVLYVIGYTINNMTIQTIPAILSNDPRQRPMIGVWTTIFNYMVPMVFSILLNVVLLPRCGGTYNQEFLSTAVHIVLAAGLVGTTLVCIGVSSYDRPETFASIGKKERLKLREMLTVFRDNRPLQCYIAAQASDKIAQQVASQSIIGTMLFGIIIGNMSLSTILSVVAMLPSIIFAIFGARYAGKHGSKKGIVTWSSACIAVAAVMVIYFIVIDPTRIASAGVIMVLYVLLTLALNGTKMCVTTCGASFMADVIDYELYRSGRFIPAVVSGAYSLLDKLISSVGAVIATAAVALIGYTDTMPQPGDACTSPLFWMTMFLYFGLPILGWIVSLIAMRFCDLDKEKMVEIQKSIEEQKKEEKARVIEDNMR